MTTAPARTLRISAPVVQAIREEARRAYPSEGCGALLGPAAGEITEAIALDNAESRRPRTRFTVEPRDYLAAEERAEALGLGLRGFWHSHPDHPAKPSPTDREYAWPGWLTLVIAVENGEPQALTAWEIAGPDAPFQEVAIESTLEVS